jgi:hypothetical protein
MSCITIIIVIFISRIVIVLWWLADRQLFTTAFKKWVLPFDFAVPSWVWPLLGFIFLPVTTLVYLFLYPGGIVGAEWIVIVIALLIDLVGHGGSYHHRHRVWRRRRDIL